MKKKVLALLLSVAFIINGCTMDNQNTVNKNKDSETAKEQKPEPEPEIDISETNPEVVAYREFLIEKADELEDEFYASFLRIDEDDIYELVVCENQDDVHVVNLYTCIDGQVTPLDTEEFSISESDELFHYIDGGNGFYSCQKTSEEDTQITTEFFYKVEDGKVVLIDAFKKAIQESGDEDTYYQNDEQISEDEFDEQMAAYDQLDYDEVDLEYFDRISSSDAADHVGIYKPYPVEVQPCLKPAIYLYPTEDNTEVTVKLDCNGEITKLDPKFNIPNGWRVTADSDGDIRLGDDTYDYLFWEANLNTRYTYKEGFCVPGKDTETFLRDKLSELGLNKPSLAYLLKTLSNTLIISSYSSSSKAIST